MSNIILLDIDYTLFNTDKFRDITYPCLQEILEMEDTPEYHTKIEHIEKSLIARGGYEPVTFAKLLMEALELPEKRKEVEELFYDKNLYRECLYPDVVDTIEALSKKKGLTLGIVSKGESTFQKRKIEPIQHYFNEKNMFISSDKLAQIDAMKDTYKEDKALVVDDSEPFLKAMKEKWNSLYVVLVERENRYEVRVSVTDFIPDQKIQTLDEILPLVDKLWQNW